MFTNAGQIAGRLPLEYGKTTAPSGKLVLKWNEMAEDDISALQQLVKQNELYTLRIVPQQQAGTPKGAPVAFSLPAACFAQALGRPHRVDLHAAQEGWLVGIDFRHQSTLQCQGEGARSLDGLKLRWPSATDVKVVFPTAAPAVQFQPSPTDDRASAQYVDDTYKQAAQGEPGSKMGDVQGEGKEKKEKTFLEKNWLLIACGGMLLMNMLNKVDPPGPPAAAGATQRRAPASR